MIRQAEGSAEHHCPSHVIEVASHDGHLLQHFSKLGIPVIGIEPDHASAVRAMKARGIPTLTGSFGRDMARRLAADGIDADLMVANNALFRVPDTDDFLAGFALLLNPEGVATFEIAPTSCLSPQMTEHSSRQAACASSTSSRSASTDRCSSSPAAETRRGNAVRGSAGSFTDWGAAPPSVFP